MCGGGVLRIISEFEFKCAIQAICEPLRGRVFSVTGPGRSGAVASVYASHYLGIAWIPFSREILLPAKLQPTLLIDTARCKGHTIKKAAAKIMGALTIAYLYDEPPMVRFFYECRSHRRSVRGGEMVTQMPLEHPCEGSIPSPAKWCLV